MGPRSDLFPPARPAASQPGRRAPLYTDAQRQRRDATVWTLVQGVLAPLQFLVFIVSLALVWRYLASGEGQLAAKLCGVMLIAQIGAALGGDFSRVQRIVKLGVFVNSTPDFTDQPKVANGASDLMVEVFGDAGKHARSAVGVPVLPLNAAVEVDAILALKP